MILQYLVTIMEASNMKSDFKFTRHHCEVLPKSRHSLPKVRWRMWASTSLAEAVLYFLLDIQKNVVFVGEMESAAADLIMHKDVPSSPEVIF
jgi:hypothetical protein